MRQPTVELPGSTFGDALGIGWFLSSPRVNRLL